jgi:hypothetical protein
VAYGERCWFTASAVRPSCWSRATRAGMAGIDVSATIAAERFDTLPIGWRFGLAGSGQAESSGVLGGATSTRHDLKNANNNSVLWYDKRMRYPSGREGDTYHENCRSRLPDLPRAIHSPPFDR